MSILISIEEYFRNRKLENQQKIFEEIHKVVAKINEEKMGSDGLFFALTSASDYKTMYFVLDKVILAAKVGIKKEKEANAKNLYRDALRLFGMLKFLMDYHGGYLGFLWL